LSIPSILNPQRQAHSQAFMGYFQAHTQPPQDKAFHQPSTAEDPLILLSCIIDQAWLPLQSVKTMCKSKSRDK
jgi:hypothetical protein